MKIMVAHCMDRFPEDVAKDEDIHLERIIWDGVGQLGHAFIETPSAQDKSGLIIYRKRGRQTKVCQVVPHARCPAGQGICALGEVR